MKKILITFLLLLYISNTQAQCPDGFSPNGFVDFIDTNGNSHSLDDYLFYDKIVVLDFYLLTCGSCIASAPCIENLYQNYGWNNGDVIVLAFDVGDGDSTDEVAIQWAQNYGMPNVPNFSQKGGTQNTSGFWGQFYSGCGDNGGFAQSYVLTSNFCCGDPLALNYEIGCDTYCGNNSCCLYDENESLPIQGVSYSHQGGVVDCTQITDHIDSLLDEMISLNNNSYNSNKNIINTVNIFGQSINTKSNIVLFNIFDDGSVEKKYILDIN